MAESIFSRISIGPAMAKSPEPLAEQKVQPPVPFVPSLVGQVQPISNEIL